MEVVGARPKMTKQSAARQQVLELIERLGVGTAIPSERQLSVDLGVSRLTRPRRARRPGARGLPRAPPGQRHIRAATEDRAAAHDDLVQRGHAPARDDAEQHDALAHAPARRAPPRPLPQCLPRARSRRRQAASARRRRLDGDRDASHPGRRRAGRRAAGSRGIVLRAPARALRRSRSRPRPRRSSRR